jgi:F-type H+-transporting ATPase subunit gamma
MATIETLRRRIRTAEDLQSVVKTMKGLAAVSIRQYERAVESLADYSRAVELGFQVLLRQRPDALAHVAENRDERVAAVVFGSEQGLCGPLNREIAQHMLGHFDRVKVGPSRRMVAAVGARVVVQMETSGQPVTDIFTPPGSVAGITPRIQDMLVQIDAWRTEQQVNRILLFHHRPTSGRSYRPRVVHLLPIDIHWLRSLRRKPWPTRVLPTFTMDWQQLFSSLVRQHLFVSLYRAFAESLASENTSRLASMQAAEKNIEERLAGLQMRFHRQRQAAITEELLDVTAGFEAISQVSNR